MCGEGCVKSWPAAFHNSAHRKGNDYNQQQYKTVPDGREGGPQVPEYVHEKRTLHSARLSAREFAAIEDALLIVFNTPPNNSITWEFTRKRSRSNTGDNLETVLAELADKSDITGFKITAESNDTSDAVTVTGNALGCFLEYTASEALLDRTQMTLRLIEGVFKDHRRKRTHFGYTAAPFLEIGAKKPGLKLSWNVIAQDVITRSLSYVVTAAAAFILGLLWARFS